VVTCLPIQGWCSGDPLNVAGRPIPEGAIPPVVALRRAGPGYFDAMGIDVLAGRAFEPADHEAPLRTALVSRRLAELYFPDQDPLGERIAVGGDTTWSTIVGVVDDVPALDLRRGGDPLVYFPLAGTGFGGVSPHAAAVALRAADGVGLLPAVRARTLALDGNLAIAEVRTTARIVQEASARLAFAMALLLIASVVALALGAVGVYGVVTYLVGRRRTEIGVRMALGARVSEVRGMILREGGWVAAAGLAVGVVVALLLTRFMGAVLFGVGPRDPVTFGVVSALLLAVALLATLLAARAATRVEPARALRAE
jgi:hypothetical protein